MLEIKVSQAAVSTQNILIASSDLKVSKLSGDHGF